MQNFKSQTEFDQALAKELERFIERKEGIHVRAEPTTVMKNNSQVMNGISVRFPSSVPEAEPLAAPNLYTADAFERYKNGEPFQRIAENMSVAAIRASKRDFELPEFTPEEAKEHLYLVLVNTERNEQLLAKTPHFEVGDLSAIPRWRVSEEASFIVTNDLAANMQLTPEEVLAIGQQNVNQQVFEVKTMQEVMRSMMGDMDPQMMDMMFPEEIGGPKMVVMTTQSHVHGASAILSEQALSQAQEMLGTESIIILPSSTHEVIVVPDNGEMDPDQLRAMVREVNSTQVEPQDFLSDNIMRYDGEKLSLVMEQPTVEIPFAMDEHTIHYAGMKM